MSPMVGIHSVLRLLNTRSIGAYPNNFLVGSFSDACDFARVVGENDGFQYCSDLYQQTHIKHGIRCSMTDGYDCYQNAMAERVNEILKTELLLHRPQDLADAVKMVDESVQIYNGGATAFLPEIQNARCDAPSVLRLK